MDNKEIEILSKAEDVILREIEHYLKTPEMMSDKDIYNFQLMVITQGRILSIKEGQNGFEAPGF